MKKQTIHYLEKYLQDPVHQISVVLIGVGGTGSLVAARLARLDYALRELGHPGFSLQAFDADVVQAHNVGRQNFFVNDIGENKAINVIEKINMAFGLEWEAIPRMIDKTMPNANIYITCVDNAEFRMKFDAFAKVSASSSRNYSDATTPFYWLDCGNGKDFGQVILSTIKNIPQPKQSVYDCASILPSLIDIYGDIARFDNEETQGIAGCSMAESLSKQDLFINDQIAVNACQILSQLIRNKRLHMHGVIIKQDDYRSAGIRIPETKKPKRKSKTNI